MLSREIKRGTCQCQFCLIYFTVCVVVKWSALMKLTVTLVNPKVPWYKIGWVNLIMADYIYSFTTNLWWKSAFIRSFHSSVFLSLESTPPMQNALYSPFVSRLNPKRRWLAWATHSFLWWVRWAESGGLTRCELKWPSFGCLKCERVDGSSIISFHFIADWLTE